MRRWLIRSGAGARIAAEQAWCDFGRETGQGGADLSPRWHIRAGVRSPLKQLREGKARRIIQAGPGLQRIHVAEYRRDAACLALTPLPPERIYNLVDDGRPLRPRRWFPYAADLLGLAPSARNPLRGGRPLAHGASLLGNCKRSAANRRIRTELGVDLRYTDLSRRVSGFTR